jgi:NADPH:quinone reductase-like Zn-dependent oxidoreductase
MKAILFDKQAKPLQLVERDVPMPEPKRGELRVRVRASSINAADWRSMRMGIIPRSRIFGADVCGAVDAVGPGVEGWQEGDEAVGDLSNYGFGGFAEFACASAEAFVRKPAGLDPLLASAVPLAGVTALQALRAAGDISAGQTILVVGASGGVGTFAVQLARHMGANVTAVTSGANAKAIADLGAKRVIDYTKEDYASVAGRFDRILAVHGNASIGTYTRLLKKGGTCAVVGGSLRQVFAALILGPLWSLGRTKHRAIAARSNAKDLAYLLELVARGTIAPSIERVYRFAEIPLAMDYAQKGHARGKLVIDYEEE